MNNIIKANECFEQADNYEYGKNGYSQDFEKARQNYEEASALGHQEALCCLGLLYQKGKGVEQNFDKAISYYNNARENGSANAIFLLAECYYYGIGFSKDIAKGCELYREAYIKSSPFADMWFRTNTKQI